MSDARSQRLVLLHGFAGTHRTWEGVIAALGPQRYRPLALDLRGHGTQRDRRPIDFPGCVEDVLGAVEGRFGLVGYSLGGRVALHAALAEPERVARLVLIGAGAGIEDQALRWQRREADLRLAERLEQDRDIESFADEWRAQELFVNDPEGVSDLAREDYRRNDPVALAASLRGLGSGSMESLWGRLGVLAMPVTVVSGERDARYQQIGRRMARCVPDGRHVIVPGGHAVHLETPSEVARLIAS